MKKILIFIIFPLLSISQNSTDLNINKDTSFVKAGLISGGSVSIVSGLSLIYVDNKSYLAPKAIPIGIGFTLLISGLFYKKR